MNLKKFFDPAYWKKKKQKFRIRKRKIIAKTSYFQSKILSQYVKETLSIGYNDLAAEYVKKTDVDLSNKNIEVKTLAIYLPQYHPFPENDEWWGKGFTEWTNVTKARPQYIGHYQPHLPGELGFYDLRLPEVLKQQAGLARKYGISGFCFYDYWFDGKKLMQTPIENFIKNKDIDIDFCICWANENWTRRWDGNDQEILIKQEHSPEDDIAYIESLFCAFSDDRYIYVDEKPLFLIYRASLLPNPKETMERWRTHAAENGFKGIYIVSVQSFDLNDPSDYGCDAAVEFPPNQGWRQVAENIEFVNPDFKGVVFEYEKIAESYMIQPQPSYKLFKSVVVSWDNEARRPGRGTSLFGATPALYGEWFEKAVSDTMIHEKGKRFVFVNAWNEWAEGNHLEPCRKFGYGYLEATAEVLKNYIIPKGE